MRQEVVRPGPRFSSLYLRLPDKSLPTQEQQIAANFVSLSDTRELVRAATLLHRYTTRAVLPAVLPFIDKHLADWPCGLQIPVLAYLLKVSPRDARHRLEHLLEKVRPPYCPGGEFFPSLGFIEASPVLDTLAARQVEIGTPLAVDSTMYLKTYGNPAMKAVVWQQLSHWHKQYVGSGEEERINSQSRTQDDWALYNLDSRLLEAYVAAQGWVLSAEDEANLSELIGDKKKQGLSCTFACGSSLSVGSAPGSYYIYGRKKDTVSPAEDRIDYLTSTQPFHYSINQYRCANLKTLEQKLLQFPVGSTFSVAHTGSLDDGKGDWTSIDAFLRSHGYFFKN